MAEEQKGDDLQNILSDLDNILSDVASPAAAPTPAPEPAAPPEPKPRPEPKPEAIASPPKPAPAAVVPPPQPAPKPPPLPDETIEIPIPAQPPAKASPPEPVRPAPGGLTIELGAKPTMPAPAAKPPPPAPAPKPALTTRPPLEISIETPGGPSNSVPAPKPPVEPKAEPPKPVPAASAPPPVAPVPPPVAPAPPPAPATAVVAAGAEDVPDKTPKEQIRRVAFVYTAEHKEKKDALAKFMASSAQTISKKPLYLRRVLHEEVGASADGKGILARVEAVKAVAVLGILEGLPEAKVRELTEVFSGAGILFRVVAPEEIQKRSMAVDLIVDMMLLSSEG